MNFKLKAPCGNCPFRRDGAIDLAPGRLDGIIASIMEDDMTTFPCHKTVHSKVGGEWDDDGTYHPSGNESACMGAIAYCWKRQRTSVLTRIALLTGDITRSEIEEAGNDVIA